MTPPPAARPPSLASDFRPPTAPPRRPIGPPAWPLLPVSNKELSRERGWTSLRKKRRSANVEHRYLQRDTRGLAWRHDSHTLVVEREDVVQHVQGLAGLEPPERDQVVDLLTLYARGSAVPEGSACAAWPPATRPLHSHIGWRVAVAWVSKQDTWFVEGGVLERHRDFEGRLFIVSDTRLDPDGRVAALDYLSMRTLAERGNAHDVDPESPPPLLLLPVRAAAAPTPPLRPGPVCVC